MHAAYYATALKQQIDPHQTCFARKAMREYRLQSRKKSRKKSTQKIHAKNPQQKTNMQVL